MEGGAVPRIVRAQLVIVGPLLFGSVTGFLLVLRPSGYWIATAIASVAGAAGARAVDTGWPPVLGGAVSGASFGIGVVVAQVGSGMPPRVAMPSPIILLALISACAGASLAWLGARVAPRREAGSDRA